MVVVPAWLKLGCFRVGIRVSHGNDYAVNGLLQLAKRLARGFRSLRDFRIMAYLKAAGLHLDLPSLKPSPVTHSK